MILTSKYKKLFDIPIILIDFRHFANTKEPTLNLLLFLTSKFTERVEVLAFGRHGCEVNRVRIDLQL